MKSLMILMVFSMTLLASPLVASASDPKCDTKSDATRDSVKPVVISKPAPTSTDKPAAVDVKK